MNAQRTDSTIKKYIDKCAIHAVVNGKTEEEFVALWIPSLQPVARDAYKIRNTPQRKAKGLKRSVEKWKAK